MMIGYKSNFVGLEAVEEEPEVGSLVGLLLPEAENQSTFIAVVGRSVDGEIVKFLHKLYGEFLEAFLELFFPICGKFVRNFFPVFLHPALHSILIQAYFLILEVVNKVIDLQRRGSSSSFFILILILSSEGIAASDIDIFLSLDNHLALHFGNNAVELLQGIQLVPIRDDVNVTVQVLVNSHLQQSIQLQSPQIQIAQTISSPQPSTLLPTIYKYSPQTKACLLIDPSNFIPPHKKKGRPLALYSATDLAIQLFKSQSMN